MSTDAGAPPAPAAPAAPTTPQAAWMKENCDTDVNQCPPSAGNGAPAAAPATPPAAAGAPAASSAAAATTTADMSEHYNQGFKDGHSWEPHFGSPRVGEALAAYQKGYKIGHAEFVAQKQAYDDGNKDGTAGGEPVNRGKWAGPPNYFNEYDKGYNDSLRKAGLEAYQVGFQDGQSNISVGRSQFTGKAKLLAEYDRGYADGMKTARTPEARQPSGNERPMDDPGDYYPFPPKHSEPPHGPHPSHPSGESQSPPPSPVPPRTPPPRMAR